MWFHAFNLLLSPPSAPFPHSFMSRSQFSEGWYGAIERKRFSVFRFFLIRCERFSRHYLAVLLVCALLSGCSFQHSYNVANWWIAIKFWNADISHSKRWDEKTTTTAAASNEKDPAITHGKNREWAGGKRVLGALKMLLWYGKDTYTHSSSIAT